MTIPVRLYLATESKGVSFNMLHARCLNRIQMKTYCPVDDERRPWTRGSVASTRMRAAKTAPDGGRQAPAQVPVGNEEARLVRRRKTA